LTLPVCWRFFAFFRLAGARLLASLAALFLALTLLILFPAALAYKDRGLRNRTRRRRTMPKSLRDLFVEELRDMYDGEKQLTRALPKMVRAADSEDLRSNPGCIASLALQSVAGFHKHAWD
jgi:hypothetical protein